jgi:hypothetical protein
VIAVSLPNTFQATEYRTLRAAVFSGLGLWGIVPVAHQLVWYWDVWAIRTAFKLDLLMGALYLVGRARAHPARPGPREGWWSGWVARWLGGWVAGWSFSRGWGKGGPRLSVSNGLPPLHRRGRRRRSFPETHRLIVRPKAR